ncbi:DUF971 family protein [Andreprevotia lacus DSM 23236]|jgi:DUF971 family protein|uniref:DUF971 family protein n=1 Tax=Andreprevotia lacus DSM 23236 TaxID=1121001 RepID=A0A1W1XGJ9_9NEIS|nr:DUF971 domain-containing protein [Andreprevotia lacus]SMC22641.1 DUF971 family protein [Andreprevotia lacus DSM 23236]
MTPQQLDLHPAGLTLAWPDGTATLNAARLRAACRCADCRAASLRGQPLPIPDQLQLAHATPLGHYALQLHFSDGHERGIYPWSYLHELALPLLTANPVD